MAAIFHFEPRGGLLPLFPPLWFPVVEGMLPPCGAHGFPGRTVVLAIASPPIYYCISRTFWAGLIFCAGERSASPRKKGFVNLFCSIYCKKSARRRAFGFRAQKKGRLFRRRFCLSFCFYSLLCFHRINAVPDFWNAVCDKVGAAAREHGAGLV